MLAGPVSFFLSFSFFLFFLFFSPFHLQMSARPVSGPRVPPHCSLRMVCRVRTHIRRPFFAILSPYYYYYYYCYYSLPPLGRRRRRRRGRRQEKGMLDRSRAHAVIAHPGPYIRRMYACVGCKEWGGGREAEMEGRAE